MPEKHRQIQFQEFKLHFKPPFQSIKKDIAIEIKCKSEDCVYRWEAIEGGTRGWVGCDACADVYDI